MMYIITVFWSEIDSFSEDQHIGPFLAKKDAEEWGAQIIGNPEGTPWCINEVDSPTSCVKQFRQSAL